MTGKVTISECEELIASAGKRQGAVLCSRATVGLAAVLKALKLPRGSGVVMPVMACANVAHAVRGAGLRPVFSDVEGQHGGIGISTQAARRVIENDGKCKVLLAVPLFGGGVDGEALRTLAHEYGLVIVEDAAQKGLVPSASTTMGVCSVVSFGAGKVGEAGGGGAVLSDDAELLARVRFTVGHNIDRRVDPQCIARAIERLPGEIAARKEAAGEYRRRLSELPGTLEQVGEVLPIWKYSVLVSDRATRDRATARLVQMGVAATNLYPTLSAWFGGAQGEKYEGAWRIWSRIINLPVPPQGPGVEGLRDWGVMFEPQRHRVTEV